MPEYDCLEKDIENQYKRLIDQQGKQVNFELYVSIAHIQIGLSKQQLKNQLRQSLKQAILQDATHFVFYFGGPGDSDQGQWVTYGDNDHGRIGPKSKQLVHIDFILDQINKSGFKNIVKIITESDYGGLLTEQAKAWVELNNQKQCVYFDYSTWSILVKPNNQHFKYVEIEAATGKQNQVVFGQYREF